MEHNNLIIQILNFLRVLFSKIGKGIRLEL